MGVRRYQNPDGTLTEAGRYRYSREGISDKWDAGKNLQSKETLKKSAVKSAGATVALNTLLGAPVWATAVLSAAAAGIGPVETLIKGQLVKNSAKKDLKVAEDYYLNNGKEYWNDTNGYWDDELFKLSDAADYLGKLDEYDDLYEKWAKSH
jgi:hypothetical protein